MSGLGIVVHQRTQTERKHQTLFALKSCLNLTSVINFITVCLFIRMQLFDILSLFIYSYEINGHFFRYILK